MSGRGVKMMALKTVILRCQHVKFDFTQSAKVKVRYSRQQPQSCVVSQCSSRLHVLISETEYSADLEGMGADNSCRNCSKVMMVC